MFQELLNSTIQAIVNSTTKCTKHLNKVPDSAHNYHSNHHGSSSNLHDGMIMSFHLGFKETILFDFWKTETLPMFILSCILLFVIAVLYEGLKLVREILIRRELIKTNSSVLNNNSTIPIKKQCHCNKNPQEVNNTRKDTCVVINGDDQVAFLSNKNQHKCCCDPQNETSIITFKSYTLGLFSKGHVVQTFLHMIQITISYLLMLVFMTYNTWLCLSVVLGAGVSFFVFGTQRLTSIDVNEHCH